MEKIDYDLIENVARAAEICGTTPEELIAFVDSLIVKYDLKYSDFEGSA